MRQVFTDFTVFASQFAYYVRACDRCRLVNSAWVETTAGVYDEARDCGSQWIFLGIVSVCG